MEVKFTDIENAAIETAKNEFTNKFGTVLQGVYRVPYSVLLAGDGEDFSIATDKSRIIRAEKNNSGFIKFSALGYSGQDVIDVKQAGPFNEETGTCAYIVRGVCAALVNRKITVTGGNIFACCDTLPGAGLEEASHFCTSLLYVFNDLFSAGLSRREISDINRWVLANYGNMECYATDPYTSLNGNTLLGDFTNPEKPILKEIKPNFAGYGMYVVNIGNTNLNLDEDIAEAQIDRLISALGCEPEDMTEEEFYAKIEKMSNPEKESVLFLADFYTQENFEKLYRKNVTGGTGSPVVEATVKTEAETCGKNFDKCLPKTADWKLLCCVKDDTKEIFTKAVEKIFGENCIEILHPATHSAVKI